MNARLRWALGFGTLDAALFVALLAALRYPELGRPATWGFFAALWAMCVAGAWLALRFAPELPRVDVSQGAILLAMGGVVGACVGVASMVIVLYASGEVPTAPLEAAGLAILGTGYAMFVGAVLGFLAALVDLGVVALVNVATRGREVRAG